MGRKQKTEQDKKTTITIGIENSTISQMGGKKAVRQFIRHEIDKLIQSLK